MIIFHFYYCWKGFILTIMIVDGQKTLDKLLAHRDFHKSNNMWSISHF